MRRNKKTIVLFKNKEKCTNTKFSNAIEEQTCVIHLSDEGEDECFIVKGPKEVKVFFLDQTTTTT
jgi:hypothetical protein